MPITIGTRLGSHEIIALLGKGGMGEVYRARDTKLKREVAIKVLPDEFSSDSNRVNRFRREAEALASLNHPNIAAIYDVVEERATRFLVLELVEGETLAARIRRGPIPLNEALPIAKQIAEALEAAHAKGLTHRDIKPANIKITPEGQVKVLDFGLVKALAVDRAGLDHSELPTEGRTEDGHILGTPGYMSPEQIRNRPAEKQTDIWAFGCVLYEAVTGKPAFWGETSTDTIVLVLGKEPDWEALPSGTPQEIRNLLRRCLQKDPNRRLHDIGDARIEIEDMISTQATQAPASLSKVAKTRNAKAWVLSGLLLLAIASVAIWRFTPAPRQPVVHLNMGVEPADQLTGLT